MKERGSRSLLHVLAALPPIEQEAGWGLATLRGREESFAPAGKGTTHDWFVVWLPTYVALSIALYAGCPRRNVQDFGRVFLMLKYSDITQNTYIQS